MRSSFSVETAEQQETERKEAALSGKVIPGLASFADWQRQNFRRLGYRAQWQSYFDEVDVFLSPVGLQLCVGALTTANRRTNAKLRQ